MGKDELSKFDVMRQLKEALNVSSHILVELKRLVYFACCM